MGAGLRDFQWELGILMSMIFVGGSPTTTRVSLIFPLLITRIMQVWSLKIWTTSFKKIEQIYISKFQVKKRDLEPSLKKKHL